MFVCLFVFLKKKKKNVYVLFKVSLLFFFEKKRRIENKTSTVVYCELYPSPNITLYKFFGPCVYFARIFTYKQQTRYHNERLLFLRVINLDIH